MEGKKAVENTQSVIKMKEIIGTMANGRAGLDIGGPRNPQ